MGNDWLTEELMQRAANIIQEIDGIASQGTVYVVSRALYEAEKRGKERERERCARIADEIGSALMDRTPAEAAKAIRAGN